MCLIQTIPIPEETAIGKLKRSAFLGFGFLSFCDDNNLGMMPTLVVQTYNTREPTAASLKALKMGMGHNPWTNQFSRLGRGEPENAITVMINSQLLDLGSLEKSAVASGYGYAVFKRGAENSSDHPEVLNGNHRRVIAQEIGCKQYEAYLKAGKHLENVMDLDKEVSSRSKKTTEASEEHVKSRSVARMSSRWLVAFYDEGERSNASWISLRQT